ncbi:MAG: patatin-like phospholipase family protein [Lewinellaceae bacterium]|nr:patatin-like phospholipase family protein [Saprospiraceae bacterium]MCB9338320.1 patatin-like phospholipase family protein [Lewinellaceae bacterium]
MRKWISDAVYSFPFQLVVMHLRSNLLLLAAWALLAMMVTGNFGGKFGLRYLFLSPEYLGQVGFMSFFYVGVGFGAFVMSWNLTTYLLTAYRFSFLASLARPFTKFAFNNLFIPITFAVIFLVAQIRFGIYHELQPLPEVIWNSVGFLTGFTTLVLAIALYFNFTNKDIFSLLQGKDPIAQEGGAPAPDHEGHPVIENIKLNRNQWRVDTYLTESFRPRLVRSVAHYDAALLLRIFRQNHLNALIVQLFTLVLLVLLGALMDKPSFRIPTGASIFLLGSMVTAVAGAISYWFSQWRMTALLILLFVVNLLTRFEFFHHKNRAYGLNYKTAPAVYQPDSLLAICSAENVDADKATMLAILEKWRQKTGEEKPKMAFFCVSGGGLKSAAWAIQVLQATDSISAGKFFNHTVLMSGASGGMIGTSYYRELNLLKQQGQPIDLYSRLHIYDASRDLLNPISFTIVTNDLFLPWATFEEGGFRYKKDRGYIFEKAMNENMHNRFDKTVGDYARPEQEAAIPLIFITPAIVNDGRRMVISAQPVSYMMIEPAGIEVPGSLQVDAVDFGRLFRQQGAQNLRFTTALRMNATYPYVLPNVYLPSEPDIEVLDAGFRDNFGLKSATRFVHVFKDWIKENTSGVVFVIVRAFDRQHKIEATDNRGVFETMLNPLEIAFKVMSLQDYEHDSDLGFIFDILGKENFDIVRFTYQPSEALKDSPISFYLTERERKDVLRAITTEESVQSLKKLKELVVQRE